MQWASWRNRAPLILSGLAMGILVGQLTPPVWRTVLIAVKQPRYAELTYHCDRAMREHMLAKFQIGETPSESTVASLRSAELALLDCQDYDILRKELLMWGLTENELSLMTLHAIETDAATLQQVVQAHEIRF